LESVKFPGQFVDVTCEPVDPVVQEQMKAVYVVSHAGTEDANGEYVFEEMWNCGQQGHAEGPKYKLPGTGWRLRKMYYGWDIWNVEVDGVSGYASNTGGHPYVPPSEPGKGNGKWHPVYSGKSPAPYVMDKSDLIEGSYIVSGAGTEDANGEYVFEEMWNCGQQGHAEGPKYKLPGTGWRLRKMYYGWDIWNVEVDGVSGYASNTGDHPYVPPTDPGSDNGKWHPVYSGKSPAPYVTHRSVEAKYIVSGAGTEDANGKYIFHAEGPKYMLPGTGWRLRKMHYGWDIWNVEVDSVSGYASNTTNHPYQPPSEPGSGNGKWHPVYSGKSPAPTVTRIEIPSDDTGAGDEATSESNKDDGATDTIISKDKSSVQFIVILKQEVKDNYIVTTYQIIFFTGAKSTT